MTEIIVVDIVKLIVSLIVGSILGAEREYHRKSAGFRTIILICVSSTLFTILSFHIGGDGSHDRMAANIITGIGFLGAGAIFRNENSVSGLNTAVLIWVVAAIGMAIGGGLYAHALIVTFAVLSILVLFPHVEKKIEDLNCIKKYTISLYYEADVEKELSQIVKSHRLSMFVLRKTFDKKSCVFLTEIRGKRENHPALESEIRVLDNFISISIS